jgi:hypothetical protein
MRKRVPIAWMRDHGKLLVAVSVILSVIMGVAGFKWQQIMLPLILGLLLGSINGIVGLFF